MAQITFVTGPVRSGKSRFALELARTWGEGVVFGATYRSDPADSDMQARVRRHRLERPSGWRTLEAPEDFAQALGALDPPPNGLLFDCLTLWLGARMDASDEAILSDWQCILEYLRLAPYPAVIVSNEIGWSLVPEHPELRRFRDIAGWLGQATAAASNEVWLCVAGCPLQIKSNVTGN
ncbi:MAG TPA: bifunctional adenosylcobinamide kinase/adenosylcobinamide-phosphate guanylyltransferase [Holophagaceae bacterium]|nr:bifunctional adenosylcobinamide kinase/adenosylcobinamide-phosphate guanylyltransferase [Holophagaceae bacterium]